MGITIGCILGMCPLLFMKYPDKEKKTEGGDESKVEPIVVAVAAVTP